MIELVGNKVVLQEATNKDIDELYFGKFEEEQQEAKKWNGPYLPEKKITKEEYRKEWREEIVPDVPASLVIKSDGKVLVMLASIGWTKIQTG